MFCACVFRFPFTFTYSVCFVAIAFISAFVVPFFTSISNVLSSTLVAFLPSKYTFSNPKLFCCLCIVSLYFFTVPSSAVTVIVFIVSPFGKIMLSSSCPSFSSPPIVTFAKIFDNTIFTFAISSVAFTVIS